MNRLTVPKGVRWYLRIGSLCYCAAALSLAITPRLLIQWLPSLASGVALASEAALAPEASPWAPGTPDGAGYPLFAWVLGAILFGAGVEAMYSSIGAPNSIAVHLSGRITALTLVIVIVAADAVVSGVEDAGVFAALILAMTADYIGALWSRARIARLPQ